MKHFAYTFFVLLAIISSHVPSANAQSLEFTKKPSGPVNFDLEVDVAKINLHVKNVSSAPVRVWVTMDTSGISPAHRAYFCWEQCYSFGVVDARNIAGGKPLTLKPGQDTSAFTAYVDHYAVYNEPRAGTSTLTFDFFNEDDPSDRISISLVFNVGNATSVDDQLSQTSSPIWNPITRTMLMPNDHDVSEIKLYAVDGSEILYNNHHPQHITNGIYGYLFQTKVGEIKRGIISIY